MRKRVFEVGGGGMLTITCEDCMDLMARYPDKYFELAIVDPPYGIGEDGGDKRRRRKGKWAPKDLTGETECGKPVITKLCEIIPESLSPETYAGEIRGTVEEVIADAIIRICDIAGVYKIDMDWHVRAKMAYNKTRPYLHGKIYG